MPHTDYERYQLLTESIVGDAQTRWREFTILGGRGLGKSTVAAALANRFRGAASLNPVRMLAGRSATAAIAALRDLTERDYRGSLIVDDADHLLEQAEARTLVHTLLTARSWQDPQRLCVVLTAENYLRLQQAAAFDLVSSDLIGKAATKDLNPWLGQWLRATRNAVVASLGPGADDAPVEAWSVVVAAETGGHPLLVDRALGIIRTLVVQEPGAIPIEVERVRNYLTPHLESHATALVTKAVHDYRVRRPDDFRDLVAAAGDGGSTGIPDSARQTGLAYSTPTQSMIIAGALVRRSLSRMMLGEPLQVRPDGESVQVRPDGSTPTRRGEVVRLRQGRVVAAVTLSESLWRLFEKLRKADGELVPTNDLLKCVDSDSDAALSSALQRLRASLEKIGLHHGLQNVRSLGYRWDGKLAGETQPASSLQ